MVRNLVPESPAPTPRRRVWGLRRVPESLRRASTVEQRWRWPTVVALLATIPAFYAELLPAAQRVGWDTLAYLIASLVVLSGRLHVALATGHPRPHLLANGLDLLLAAGLLAAALEPASSASAPALALRGFVAALTLLRLVWSIRPWITRGGLLYLMLVACAVLLMCGVGFWWLEPNAVTLEDGLWLAFTTAATVGYGDIVPSTPASRIFSVFVVLLGYGVLTLATAALATSWIETEERRVERAILQDLHRQIGVLRSEIDALRTEQRAGRAAQIKAARRAREPHPPP